MKAVTITFSFICLAAASLAQTNLIPISNLNQLNQHLNGGFPVGTIEENDPSGSTTYTNTVSVSFTTGNTTTFLSSVSVSIGGLQSSELLNFSLYSDFNGSPGNDLATLSGNNYPTNSGTYAYTDSSTSELLTNTTYWLVASSSGSPYIWNAINSSNLDSGSFWTLGVAKAKQNSGSDWKLSPGDYPQFSVTVTTNLAPPMISISQPIAFQPIVLTYPTTSFPFVLQQNSDLAPNNWVTVTNAIFSGTTISNQTFFVLPLANLKMFYRLKLEQ